MNANRLFVGNLAYQTMENDLQEYFSQAGGSHVGKLSCWIRSRANLGDSPLWNLPRPRKPTKQSNCFTIRNFKAGL